MNFSIRAIAPIEAETYYDEGKYLFSTIRIPLDNMKKYLAQHNGSSNPVLGAFDDKGTLLGWIDINISNIEELMHIGTIAMGVRRIHRGQGIGSALLDACISQARMLGLEKLELEVFASNSVARALYKKKGFFEEGIRLKKRKFEGHYDDLVCMGLFL